MNVPKIRVLTRDWEGDMGKAIEDCGMEIHNLQGGDFVRAEALAAAFDCGIFGGSRKGLLRIFKVSSMNDLEPPLSMGAVRVSQADAAFNAFTGKLFQEPLIEALRRSGNELAGAVPRGGDASRATAERLEDMIPFEAGLRMDVPQNPDGGFLWIRFLSRDEE